MKSKSEKIRQAIAKGMTPKEIASALKVPINTVYTIRWKQNKAKRKPSPIASKTRVEVKAKKATPTVDFIREELAATERRINDLTVIASYLTIRLRQAELNAE